MKKALRWIWLLNKRLYKKPSFLILLLCIPLLTLAFSTAAASQKGFVTVALASENPADPLGSRVISQLMEEDSLIHFLSLSSPQEASLAVQQGQADGAWIFHDRMAQTLGEFSHNPQSVVTVVEREQTVFTRIAREKLSGVLFPYCARGLYINYIRETLPQLEGLTDQKLEEIYQTVSISQELFTFETPEGETLSPEDTNYLTAPIRGLLAVFLTLTCMAATLFTMQDKQQGTFCYLKGAMKKWLPLATVLIAAFNGLAVVLITLFACGLSRSLGFELLWGIALCLASAVFCLFLNGLFQNLKVYATLMIPLILAMILVCPVFLDLKIFGWLQLLFPPTYYLNGVTNSRYLWYLAAYTLLFGVGSVGLQQIKNKKVPISY